VNRFEKKLLSISLVSMFFFGSIDAWRSIVTPMIQEDMALDYLQLSTAFSLSSFGYLAGSFIGGFTVDKTGLKRVTVIGGILIAAGLMLYMSVDHLALFMAGFLISGMGGGIFEVGINGVVPAVSKSAEDQARYFNWLHGFYGIGATVVPLFGVWILPHFDDWRSGFWFVLTVLALVLMYVAKLRYEGAATVRKKADDHRFDPVAKWKPSLMLYGLLIAVMMYVMAEVGFAAWLPTYLVRVKNLTISEGAFYLSGFYLIFTAGRLTGHWWINRLGQTWAVLISSFVAIAALAIAVWGNEATLFFFIVAGIGFAAVFPTIAAIACHLFAGHAGKVLGLLFAASGIGALLANVLIGAVAATYGLKQGFFLIFLFLGCVILCMIMVMRSESKRLAACPEESLDSGI
jgi:fucose permease